MTRTLTFADVARYPRPGVAGPKQFQFAPDGQTINYLHSADRSLTQGLWAYDIATGQRTTLTGDRPAPADARPLTREEELRRERGRIRDLGVTSYQYAAHATPPVLLVPEGGALVVRRGDAPLTVLAGSEGAQSACLSPDGSQVAFVRDGELCVLDTAGGTARVLTTGAEDGITNGLAEFVAQEEMGRHEGYWWSPD
ncbi:MAG TPA: DPP IV N-terminal domain-containing protein, partial [Chloroflexia bacterium]|nr:DPP IV N-terminal domain-containing protein [Chloroflexia bacterium]